MSWSHSAMCVLFIAGLFGIAYLIGDFLKFHQHQRWVRRNQRRYNRLYRVVGLPQSDDRNWQQRFTEELRR